MNKGITSKGWIWFIRVWMTIPLALLIPHFIAFFYPDRPSEAHFMFWLIVGIAEFIYIRWFVKDILKRSVERPSLRTVGIAMMLILPILPTLRFNGHLSAADNTYNHVETICAIIAILPIIFFQSNSKSKGLTTRSAAID